MTKENKIIMVCAAILVLFVLIFAVVRNNSIGVIQTGAKEPNRIEGFDGEKTMEELSSLTMCILPKDNNYDSFAKCLTEKGAVMYGAKWCAHCIEQKDVFGDSFKYINYVECPDNINICLAAGINGYPTWIISSSTDRQ